ncbi:MAG: hypothetical protein M3281_10270 [Chloroflexota bacterium]|nr:hypothetical protein [Chloroflexota bacterium]
MWLEPQRKRDERAVALRNHELADAAWTFMRTRRSRHVLIWELAVALLGKGL